MRVPAVHAPAPKPKDPRFWIRHDSLDFDGGDLLAMTLLVDRVEELIARRLIRDTPEGLELAKSVATLVHTFYEQAVWVVPANDVHMPQSSTDRPHPRDNSPAAREGSKGGD